MSLESFTGKIKDLVITNPTGADPRSQGDDHLRGIKWAVQNDAVSKTDDQVMTGNLSVAGGGTGAQVLQADEIEAAYLSLAGGTMTGPITLPAAPATGDQAISKNQADASYGAVKVLAAVNFSTATGAAVIRKAFNCTVTYNAVGVCTINFTQPLPDTNYLCTGSATLPSNTVRAYRGPVFQTEGRTVNSIQILTGFYDPGTSDNPSNMESIHVVVYGIT